MRNDINLLNIVANFVSIISSDFTDLSANEFDLINNKLTNINIDTDIDTDIPKIDNININISFNVNNANTDQDSLINNIIDKY